MQEKQLQEVLRQAFMYSGYLYYHTHRSQHSPAGFPDTVAIRGRRMLVAELKREKTVPTDAQRHWLEAFQGVSLIETYVWRPRDLDKALQIIQRRD